MLLKVSIPVKRSLNTALPIHCMRVYCSLFYSGETSTRRTAKCLSSAFCRRDCYLLCHRGSSGRSSLQGGQKTRVRSHVVSGGLPLQRQPYASGQQPRQIRVQVGRFFCWVIRLTQNLNWRAEGWVDLGTGFQYKTHNLSAARGRSWDLSRRSETC